jgi:hypothetical protein
LDSDGDANASTLMARSKSTRRDDVADAGKDDDDGRHRCFIVRRNAAHNAALIKARLCCMIVVADMVVDAVLAEAEAAAVAVAVAVPEVHDCNNAAADARAAHHRR